MIRKILAICIIQRTFERIRNNIPVSQAAYSPGRSTTELVFSFKLLAEKAITSQNYEAHLLMLDMSKAFDTISRAKLIEDLRNIIDEDELHLVSILIKDVQLAVKCGKTIGEKFNTNIGSPQGDCASPIWFILYLANALKEANGEDNLRTTTDHSYASSYRNTEDITPSFLQDHLYSKHRNTTFEIDQQYADDTGWESNNRERIDTIEKEVPPILKAKRNLNVNTDKTERYTIKRNGDDSWKNCKYLGSKLDTEQDISRRKQLANAAYQKLSTVFNSRLVSQQVKIRLFQAYIVSIFLYNSEIWTLTARLEHQIDTFQRTLLRRITKTSWPKKISNNKLYNITNLKPWSEEIKYRRLKWLGHVSRLPEHAPVKKALREAQRPVKRPPGAPKTTWISSVNKQLRALNIDIHTALNIAQDRDSWARLLASTKSARSDGSC